MISIIVSSHNQENLSNLQKSIADTIGIEYEIIPIINNKQYSLARAYNLGAKLAQYNYLCFVHEDIIFNTSNWGKTLIKLIKEEKADLIGLVGTKIVPQFALSWYQSFLQKYLRGHIIQGLNSWQKTKYTSFSTSDFEEVVAVDGVFLFTKLSIFNELPFIENEKIEFHGYDFSMSLQIASKKLKILVSKKPLISHFSSGNIDASWFASNQFVMKQYNRLLPFISSDLKINKLELFKLNILSLINYLKYYLRFKAFR